MGEFSAFVDTNKMLLDLESNDSLKPITDINRLEGYAITNQIDEFNNLYLKYQDTIIKPENCGIITYLEALIFVNSGESLKAHNQLKLYAEQFLTNLNEGILENGHLMRLQFI